MTADEGYRPDWMRRRRRRRSRLLPKVLVALAVAAGCLVATAVFLTGKTPMRAVTDGAKKKAASVVVDQAIRKTVEAQGYDMEDGAVQEVLEQIEEEDREAVTQIIADHMDAGTISEIAGDLANGDVESAMDYARENLSEEEQETLLRLAEKYGETFGY